MTFYNSPNVLTTVKGRQVIRILLHRQVHVHVYIHVELHVHVHVHVHVLMRDEKEGRMKQARSNKQTRQSNTAHPRQSLFLRKMSCLRWDSCTLYSITRQVSEPQFPHQLYTCIHIELAHTVMK